MRLLIDRCAGRRLAEWLRSKGHDVFEARTIDPDPGDRALLERAAAEQRVLVTIDTDFGTLIFAAAARHCGVIRLPDVPAARRIVILERLLDRHAQEIEARAIVTVRGGRIRITRPNS